MLEEGWGPAAVYQRATGASRHVVIKARCEPGAPLVLPCLSLRTAKRNWT